MVYLYYRYTANLDNILNLSNTHSGSFCTFIKKSIRIIIWAVKRHTWMAGLRYARIYKHRSTLDWFWVLKPFFLYDIEHQSIVYAEVLSDSIRRALGEHSFESVVERNNSFRMLEY